MASVGLGLGRSASAIDLARNSANTLGTLAEQIMDKVPVAQEWDPVRKFLKVGEHGEIIF